ncbi:hypothetical protein ZWY2020_030348 [Hordeum vulgare]|nr:hypothetical protein ZWY2020_030348 [Hordeum vulgare]
MSTNKGGGRTTNKGGGGGKKKKEVKKETKLGMTYKKDDEFGEWYSEVHFLAYHSGLVRFIYKSIWAYGGLVGAM